jgi:uncharacterized protein YuzE
MNIKYDTDANAVYVNIVEVDVKIASTQGDWPFHVDLDDQGNVVGIEIMDAKETLSEEFLRTVKRSNSIS